ncbi:hypothetical protein SB719_19350, partial [Pantoea sp. SIMBA_079]|uniref:hypothetical protein n=1 Tax=Pantoea sp. SIMBA_079 TaxID=3085817 RepID=UPI003992B25F
MSPRPETGSRKTSRAELRPRDDYEMTVAEASRIVRQFENGTLDPELPGTIDLVNEAHRVRLHQ